MTPEILPYAKNLDLVEEVDLDFPAIDNKHRFSSPDFLRTSTQ